MPNTVLVTTLLNGPRHVVLHVYIKGDGLGEADAITIADPEDFGMSGDKRFFTIETIQSSLSGFYVQLKFEYLVDGTFIWVIPEFDADKDFTRYGGLKDRSNVLDGTGKVLLSTVGLDEGDEGSFVIKLRKD